MGREGGVERTYWTMVCQRRHPVGLSCVQTRAQRRPCRRWYLNMANVAVPVIGVSTRWVREGDDVTDPLAC